MSLVIVIISNKLLSNGDWCITILDFNIVGCFDSWLQVMASLCVEKQKRKLIIEVVQAVVVTQ